MAAANAERRASIASQGQTASSPKAPSVPLAQTGGFVNADAPGTQTSGPPSGQPAPKTVAGVSGDGPGWLDNLQVGFGGLGGLGSAPNVPRPGTSIDPSTGQPYHAGLTRAELDAKKAQEASLSELAAVPGSQPKQTFGSAGPPPGSSTAGLAEGVDAPTGGAPGSRFSQMANPVTASGSSITGPDMSALTGREQAGRQLTATVPEMTPGLELPGGWGRKSPLASSHGHIRMFGSQWA